jgi:tetratricopeptide (TPR) repeat protein
MKMLADLPEKPSATAARADLLYTLAALNSIKGDYEQAIDQWQQVLQLSEQLENTSLGSRVYNGLGNVYRALGRYEEAIVAYQQAIDLDPRYATPYNGLGNVYRALGRYQETITAFDRAIELDPKYALPHNGLGSVYGALGRYEEAIAAYQRAIELDLRFALPYNGLGIVYDYLGRYEEAIAVYQRAIELDPRYASPHYGLGNVYRNLSRYEDAVAAYRRAVDLEPNGPFCISLASLYKKLKREIEYREQIKLARELIAKENEYNQACFEAVCGNVDEAISRLTVAIETNPRYRDVARRDRDFDCIRDDPRFQALVGEEPAATHPSS